MVTIKAYTDLEQSKKLAEILPIESADMHYSKDFDGSWFVDLAEYTSVKIPKYVGNIEEHLLPCWSLAALLGIIKKYGLIDLRFLTSTFDGRGEHLTNVWCCTFDNINAVSFDIYADNPIDTCYEAILKLKEKNLL